LGEGEAPVALNMLVLVGVTVNGQWNTVSRTSLAYSISKAYLGISAILIEEAIAGNDKVIADSLPHGMGAVPERSKEAPGKGIYLQENI
jgi:hypothetical protein